ncbi:unnamed protein product [Ectocarpus sp. 6 AP-2014]
MTWKRRSRPAGSSTAEIPAPTQRPPHRGGRRDHQVLLRLHPLGGRLQRLQRRRRRRRRQQRLPRSAAAAAAATSTPPAPTGSVVGAERERQR